MIEPLRFYRARRVTEDRLCRACHRTVVRSAQAYEFWAGPYRTEVFHPECAPTSITSVLVCPDCLGDMARPSLWNALRGKREMVDPVCVRCQAGAA